MRNRKDPSYSAVVPNCAIRYQEIGTAEQKLALVDTWLCQLVETIVSSSHTFKTRILSLNNPIDKVYILVADDHALFRGGLSLLIETADKDVEITETSNFQETLQRLSENPPIDLLLMDLVMPGMNGTAGIEHIRTTFPDIPVAIISVKEDTDTIREALRFGAVGYIPKTSPPKVTTSAIQLILSGGIYLPPHILRRDEPFEPALLDDTSSAAFKDRTKQNTKSMGITPRQKEVLDLLAHGKTNKEIADCLGLTTGTVKMHTSRIFKLLNVSNRTKAVARYSQLKRELGET